MNTFDYAAVMPATTKRNYLNQQTGKVGAPVQYLTDLWIVPVMPVTPEMVQMYQIKSPRESFYTYLEGTPDITEGDTLVAGSTSYSVKAVGSWTNPSPFLEIIIERVRGT